MRLALLAGIAFATSTADARPAKPVPPAATTAKPVGAECLQGRIVAVRNDRGPSAHPLSQEPQAEAMFAVDYAEGGCKKLLPLRSRAEPRR